MESFNCTSTKSVGICSPRFLKPTRHVAVIWEISETIRSSSCTVEKSWMLADQNAILVVHPFFAVLFLSLTTTSIFPSSIAAMLTL